MGFKTLPYPQNVETTLCVELVYTVLCIKSIEFYLRYSYCYLTCDNYIYILYFLIILSSDKMFFSCSSVPGYFSSRPPLSIFLLSLLGLAAALMMLGVFCHHKTDIQDDVLDWPRLLRGMSGLRYCLGNSSQQNTAGTGVVRASLGSVPVLMEGDISSTGRLDLTLLGLPSPHNITVSLQAEAGQVCLTVESSEPILLSHLKNESVGTSSCRTPDRQLRTWTAHKRQHLPHQWCQQPGEQQLQIKLGIMSGLETFLTQDQRDVMYSHLMTTSVIIILLCLLVVLWAGVRRDTRDSLTLLPTSDSEDM